MIQWPEGLPQTVNAEDFSDGPADSRIFTPTDMGPPFVRRRFSAAERSMTCSIDVNRTQRAIFETFFKTTTGGGVLPFEMPNFIEDGQGTMTVRFGNTTPVYGRYIGEHCSISFELEELP